MLMSDSNSILDQYSYRFPKKSGNRNSIERVSMTTPLSQQVPLLDCPRRQKKKCPRRLGKQQSLGQDAIHKRCSLGFREVLSMQVATVCICPHNVTNILSRCFIDPFQIQWLIYSYIEKMER